MAISGDLKQNYIDLQQSTGERFAHMADRITAPLQLQGLDDNGRLANKELADWLRKQTDDEKAIERHQPTPEQGDAPAKRVGPNR